MKKDIMENRIRALRAEQNRGYGGLLKPTKAYNRSESKRQSQLSYDARA